MERTKKKRSKSMQQMYKLVKTKLECGVTPRMVQSVADSSMASLHS